MNAFIVLELPLNFSDRAGFDNIFAQDARLQIERLISSITIRADPFRSIGENTEVFNNFQRGLLLPVISEPNM
jgi:hypothetical protein